MRTLRILLPPSEGKQPGGRGRWSPTDGRYAGLAPARAAVADALVLTAGRPGAGAALRLAGQPLEQALAANRRLADTPALPAYRRYDGVVYRHLDYPTLPPAAKRRAQRSVLVASGLLGMSALGDPVPDYRVGMTATLGGVGRVGAHWRRPLLEALEPELAGAVVVDLLSSDYAAVLDPAAIRGCRVVRVRFERVSGTRTQVVSYDSKAAKGLLTRHLLQRPGRLDDALAEFAEDGWRLASPLPRARDAESAVVYQRPA